MLDWLIHNAQLIDGTGAPARIADVGIQADRIVAIFDTPCGASARQDLNADGLVLAPGFINSHTHDDRLLLQPPARHPKLLQGVTTVITGNCGISLAPLVMTSEPLAPLDILGIDGYTFSEFADYLNAVEAQPPAMNATCLVGHTTLRVAHMSDLERAATDVEVAAMAAALQRAMQAGAFGLSTGVYYPPARAATADEIVTVGAPMQAAQGVLTMHLRDEGDRIAEAMREGLDIAHRLKVPLVLSHHKLVSTPNHGRSEETLAMIDKAARLQSVCLDCYPYAASSTMLLPERVKPSSDVLITWSRADPTAAGKSLFDIARERGQNPEDTARSLQPAGAVYFAMFEADVRRILAHPLTMIGSDGLAHDERPHPCFWGTFARVLGHYARDENLFSLPTAIHKMTGLTANRFGLKDRGVIEVGAFADIVLFDPNRMIDRATYAAPEANSEGIFKVWVNGEQPCELGEVVNSVARKLLRLKQYELV
jgi:N-acyl-D-amino-acid deacylase